MDRILIVMLGTNIKGRSASQNLPGIQDNTESNAKMVEMELSRIVISQTSGEQSVVLSEKNGTRSFCIEIGLFEALAIERGVRQEQFERPLTHDLIWNIINGLGATVERVVISDLQPNQSGGGTFYGRIYIKHGGKVVEIDSRPSDAMAVAAQKNPPVPIFVEESVLDQVCKF
ncbi:MAG TPA: bifunctional nuclease family protein [Candidatus Brocadiia bacterium]|nr:bifunctional nuclease family protein [Candidatus Brocadiia bacterium]